jgi:hypothetical protein
MERMKKWKVAVNHGYLCDTFSLVPVSHSNGRKRGTDFAILKKEGWIGLQGYFDVAYSAMIRYVAEYHHPCFFHGMKTDK